MQRPILGILLLAIGAGAVLATADGPDFWAVTGVADNDVLNVRSAPSAKSEKIGEIPPDGGGIRNLGCKGVPTFAEWERMSAAERRQAGKRRWCKVRYGNLEGWVAGRFLEEESRPPGTPEEKSGLRRGLPDANP